MPDTITTCPYCGSPDTLHIQHCHQLTDGSGVDFCYKIICQDCLNEFDDNTYDDDSDTDDDHA